jgi:hypothetical protein
MLIHRQNSCVLAAGGAPVAVKRRAVEPVEKVKIFPAVSGRDIMKHVRMNGKWKHLFEGWQPLLT